MTRCLLKHGKRGARLAYGLASIMLTHGIQPPDELIEYVREQLGIEPAPFDLSNPLDAFSYSIYRTILRSISAKCGVPRCPYRCASVLRKSSSTAVKRSTV